MSVAGYWLAALLRLIGAGLVVAALLAIACTVFGWGDAFLGEPTFMTGSVSAALAVGLTMVYAAGDLRRGGLVAIAVTALTASAVTAIGILAVADAGDTGDPQQPRFPASDPDRVELAGGTVSIDALLIAGSAAALIVAALLSALAISSRRQAGSHEAGLADREPGRQDKPEARAERLTTTESLARVALLVSAAVLAALAVAATVQPFVDSAANLPRQWPLVAATAGGALCLAALCLWTASDLRARLTFVAIPLACAELCALLQVFQLVSLDLHVRADLLGGELSRSTVIWASLGLCLLGAVILFVLYHQAWKARYGLRFLWPIAHRGLLAMADVLLDPAQRQSSPERVADRVEAFLVRFKAHRRWLYRFALSSLQLAPILELAPRPRINPPLLELDLEQRRRFLADHFQRLPHQGGWRFVKHMRQITIRIGQQLVYAGYYGDPASYESIGYEPFTRRSRYRELDITEPGEHPLEVGLPGDVDPDELVADVCIVGTGAGGSILAYELARQGCEVLLLERGDYVQPREFNENEIEMIGRLYSDGLMQQTEDWRFTILQGSSVGGSTTVNNAVCFPPPEPVLARWNDPAEADAGLDLDRLHESVGAVESFLSVHPQTDAVLNNGASRFVEGAERLGLSGSKLDVDVVRANVKGCFGSGYCNMGCRWGKKLSMLDTALPWAQRDFPGRVRIVAECEVEKILTKGRDPVEVTGLVAKLGGHREVTIRARKKYVLSAGAIASSYLMLRSGVGRGLPVGRGFSANMGAALTAEFENPQHAYDGLQISHYGRPRDDRYVFETWFNPPAAQALNLPGWFDQHFENMRRYDHLMAAGVLVGTASNGKVGRAATGGAGVDFTPRPDDLQALSRGLRQLGEIFFAGGAKRVMLNTWGADEYTSPDQLSDLDRVCADPDYIALGTGHPQGGNVLSRDPSRGVVGPDFRVHGHSNLYICDASVFPTSLAVNPQLTVMSLAHYAAESIGAQAPA